MLAATLTKDLMHKVEWPVIATPKIDGIRCLIHPELGPVTRSFKPVPNNFVRDHLGMIAEDLYLDGELIVVDAQGRALPFNDIQSAIMSGAGEPQYKYLVFDCFAHPSDSYERRLRTAFDHVREIQEVRANVDRVQYVTPGKIKEPDNFFLYHDMMIQNGYEGTMLRHPEGPYKSGRSTVPQGWLLKFKNWEDAEGTIIGFEELMRNDNVDERDKFDLAKRSSKKAGLVPMNTLGALVLDTPWGELRVGSGFDDRARDEIWQRNRSHPEEESPDLGRRVRFKYQGYGMGELPRFPIFLGFREGE